MEWSPKKETHTQELDSLIDRAQGHEVMRQESEQVTQRLEAEEQYIYAAEWMRDEASELGEELGTLRKHLDDPQVRMAYEAANKRLFKLRDRFEDLTRAVHELGALRPRVLEAERQVNELFARVQTANAEKAELAQDMAFAEYEKRVVDIMEEVTFVQAAFERLKEGGITSKKLALLHRWLDEAQERLQETDQEYADSAIQLAQSKERKVLMDVINRIRVQYPATSLTSVYALHEDVRAAYAGISHALTLEQRRAFRPRIAQLTALIRRAEREGDVVITMARATEMAPAVAIGAVGPRVGAHPTPPPIPPVPPTTPDAIEA